MSGILALLLTCFGSFTHSSAQSWKPAGGPLTTPWTDQVSPENVWNEYPRPQMVRPDWKNLNGPWQYAIRSKDAPKPQKYDGSILVPFAIESSLSGVAKPVTPDDRLWYRRTFTIPKNWNGRKTVLHFGAVDWQTTIWLNGKEVGTHAGGYDPFSFDITDALAAEGPQEIVLSVFDPTDKGVQPRGKQTLNPHGIWYTATTGIWQTVWLEPVAATGIKSFNLTPNLNDQIARLTVDIDGRCEGIAIHAEALADKKNGCREKTVKPA